MSDFLEVDLFRDAAIRWLHLRDFPVVGRLTSPEPVKGSPKLQTHDPIRDIPNPRQRLTEVIWDHSHKMNGYLDKEKLDLVRYSTVDTAKLFPADGKSIREIAVENKPSIANAYLAVVKEQNVCIQYVRIA